MIDGLLVPGVQIDGGSSVNLMTERTMELLDLTNLVPTTLTLRMADHSRVKPRGVLKNVLTIISGHSFHVDYVVFELPDSSMSYPILLGRPWLFQAKAKNDWGKGTLTIGHGQDKVVLPMYPTQYHGESQIPITDITTGSYGYSDFTEEEDYEVNQSKADILSFSKRQHSVSKSVVASVPSTEKLRSSPGVIYQCGGPGEYIVDQNNTDNSDHAIAQWMNNYEVCVVSAMEPELEDSNISDFMKEPEPDIPLEWKTTTTPIYQEIDLGDGKTKQMVKLYKGIKGRELEKWNDFFHKYKSTFAWTYADLKGIPPELGSIILSWKKMLNQ